MESVAGKYRNHRKAFSDSGGMGRPYLGFGSFQ
jgi:hypothetical protein